MLNIRTLSAHCRRAYHATRVTCKGQPGPEYVDDSTFAQRVLQNKTPLVLVDFYADWCGPCRMISPILKRAVDQKKGKVELIKVDVDTSTKTAGKYEVTALPTVVAFAKGEELERFVGLRDEKGVEQFIAKHSPP